MAGSTTFTDDELKKFDDAMAKVRAVSDTLNGAPSLLIATSCASA